MKLPTLFSTGLRALFEKKKPFLRPMTKEAKKHMKKVNKEKGEPR